MTYDFYQDAIGCYHDWIEYERQHLERTGRKRPAFDHDSKSNTQIPNRNGRAGTDRQSQQ